MPGRVLSSDDASPQLTRIFAKLKTLAAEAEQAKHMLASIASTSFRNGSFRPA